MVNLLPTREKKEINAGRVNVLLLRYCFATLLFAGFLFLAIAAFYLLLTNSKNDAQKMIDDGHARMSEHQSTQKEVTTFQNDLKTAKTILDKEIHYSKVITKIANTIPSDVILQSLELSSKSFGKPTSISAKAKNSNDALKLKTSLEKSGIYDNVYLESVNVSDDKSGYPVNITINVTIKAEVAKS